MLTIGVQETVDDLLGDGRGDGDVDDAPDRGAGAGEVVVAGSLRRGEGGPERFVSSLGEVWVRGVEVDWDAGVRGLRREAGERCRLMRFSVSATGCFRDRALRTRLRAVLASAGHPLLGGAVALADDGGWLFTGRLSLQSHPWLADHAVWAACCCRAPRSSSWRSTPVSGSGAPSCASSRWKPRCSLAKMTRCRSSSRSARAMRDRTAVAGHSFRAGERFREDGRRRHGRVTPAVRWLRRSPL